MRSPGRLEFRVHAAPEEAPPKGGTTNLAPAPFQQSFRQLEFAFQTVAVSLWHASRFAQRSAYKTSDLEAEARHLLCSLGAKRIAIELRVEWNSRLQTA